MLGALTVHPGANGVPEREHLTAVAQQIAQAVHRAGLYEHEHRVAERLQLSLLPQLPDGTGLEEATGQMATAAYLLYHLPSRVPTVRARPSSARTTLFLLYTDGLIECRGETLDTGLDRLTRTAHRGAGLTVRERCDLFLNHRCGQDHPDDRALLVARPHSSPLSDREPGPPTFLASAPRGRTGRRVRGHGRRYLSWWQG